MQVVDVQCASATTEMQTGKPSVRDLVESDCTKLIAQVDLDNEAQTAFIDVIWIPAPKASVSTCHQLFESALLTTSNVCFLNTNDVVAVDEL